MNKGYEFLIENEEMWAKMLIEVLHDNEIPAISQSVYGVGFVMRTGTQERLRVYVPSEDFEKASKLVKELFSAEIIQE